MKSFDTSSNSLSSSQNKDRKIKVQEQIIFEAFKEKPSTMLEVAKKTGIERAYICWSIKHFREENKIGLVKKGLCSISKHRAGYYSADPDIFQKASHQPTLF